MPVITLITMIKLLMLIGGNSEEIENNEAID